MLRVGVIGVGHLGKIHARVYSELDGVELVAVSDIQENAAREVAEAHSTDSHKILATTDARDWLDKVDAVSVVVPTPVHLEAARTFLEAGKGVLVEKPLAATLAEADELISIADRSGSTLQVGHIERFNPVLSAALPHIDRPVFIECDRIHPFSLRSTDVSVILDLMIHDIDLILHVIDGEVTSVDALGAQVISPTDDLATARLVFASGCVAMVKTSRVAMNRSRKVRIFCERSYFSLDLVARSGYRVFLEEGYDPGDFLDNTGRISAPEGEAAFLAKHLRTEQLTIPDHEPLQAELRAFVQAVVNKTEPPVTGPQGRRAMKVAEEIDKSIRYHRQRVTEYLGRSR